MAVQALHPSLVPAREGRAGQGFLARLFKAFVEGRKRAAEREVAWLFEARGGRAPFDRVG